MRGLDGVGDALLEVGAFPDEPAGRDVDVAVMVEVADCAAFGHEVLGQGLLVEGQFTGDAAVEGRGQKEGGEESHRGRSNTPPAQIGCEEFLDRKLIETL